MALAVTSYMSDWALLNVHGWVWFALCVPELILVGGLFATAQSHHVEAHRVLNVFITFVIAANLSGLGLLTAALLTEKSSELSGPQLLMSGGVLWLVNVIVFGLAFR